MRKTKIVCTIGPACNNEETLSEMCLAGMNVARLNFSHGTHEQHLKSINLIKKVRKKLCLPIAIMLDTKGPEFRIGCFENKRIVLDSGDLFSFTTEDIIGDNKKVSVNYKYLSKELAPNDTILLNDGLMSFKVLDVSETEIFTVVINGGVLSDKKSMSFPNKVLSQEYLSEQDKEDLLFGAQNDVDFIACSFVSKAQNLIDVKEFLIQNGIKNIDIVAKIENRSGVDNIDEICKECDGIMIARGDMGVEIPFEELPGIQKMLITKCRLLGKRVITATEMLESMLNNLRPTRAEISDVANAVYDGTSAIMLSGETAAGKNPVLSVETMSKIAVMAEKDINYRKRFIHAEFVINDMVDAISHATCCMALDIDAESIVVCSLSGRTVRMVSRFRPPVDIIGLTTNEKTYRKLSLSWGVIPIMCDEYNSTDVLFFNAKNMAVKVLELNINDRIVITGGVTNGRSGNTNLIKVEIV